MCENLKKAIIFISLVLFVTGFSFAQNLVSGETLELQAESAQLNLADIETEHSGFTGSGYVNFENQVGSYLEWSVNSSAEGVVDFTIIFANGGDSRSLDILVNTSVVASVSFPGTSGWDDWQSSSQDIFIPAGSSTIRLLSTASEGGPNIDRVDIFMYNASSTAKSGDVNKDTIVNIVDSLLIAQFYVGLNPSVFDEYAGDVNCDKDVDIVDALLIAQFYVGLISPFMPCSSTGPTAIPTPDVTAVPTAEPNNCYTPVQGQAINHGTKLEGYGAGTTGGGGANSVTVSSLSELQNAIQSNRTIYINGTISGSGMISVKDISNISFIGIGNLGRFNGCGLSFVRASNIIVQNLSFQNASDDSINIENTTSAWIDHNTFSTSVNWQSCKQSSVKDQFDGQIDIKKNSANITVSYNYIHDACKAMLLGFSDGKEPDNYITYHHNRFENIGSRLPLIRHANTHVYNNYYKNVLITGINVRMGANALIENNFFENVDDPILSADSDEIGFWNVSGNLYAPSGPSYTHNPEGSDVVGEVVNCEVRSTTNWRVNYTYTLDKAVDVPATVLQYAGAGKM